MTGRLLGGLLVEKWGLRGLSKVAAMEFAPWQIRVNAIHPGIVNTAIVPGDTAFPTAMSRFTPPWPCRRGGGHRSARRVPRR